MAAPYNPPFKGGDLQLSVGVEDMSNPGSFKANPTIAAGDWKISKDDGAYANLTNLPTVAPSGSTDISIVLTTTEMNADKIVITGIDQTSPKEWADVKVCILTTA